MANLVSTLESILGADAVLGSEQIAQALPKASLDALGNVWPAAIAYPNTEAQLSAVLACAHKHQWRVLPCGQGSKLAWGGLAQGIDLVLSTARLNQVIDHAVGDMTLTAQAGLTLADLAPRLAQHHQFLALDPAYPQRASLGGMVATADTGALRQRYGGVRDMLIGLSFVRYDGQVAKAGGRVVKNVAGYDLMKLLTGSYGTLGVISQLTFRLFPVQDASTTVLVLGNAAAVRSLAAAVRLSSLTPVALDLISPALTQPLAGEAVFALAARFQSIAPGVVEQVEQLVGMIPPDLKPRVLSQEADLNFWTDANRVLFPDPATLAPEMQSLSKSILLKIGLRPAAAIPFLDHLIALAPHSLARIHAHSGLGMVRLIEDGVDAEVIQALRSDCEQAGGYLTLLEAPLALKQALDVWGYPGNALNLMKAIKTQFDPNYCLSPGRFVGGL